MDELTIGDVFNWARQKRAFTFSYVVPEDTLGDALVTMAKANLLTIPIIENYGHGSRERYHGMLDTTDIIHVSMQLLGPGELADGWKETIEGVLQRKIKEMRDEFSVISDDDKVQLSDPLPDVLRKRFVRTEYHHLTVFDGEHACGIISQNDVVEFMSEYPNLLGQKVDCPVEKLGITSTTAAQLLRVTEEDCVLAGLQLANRHGKREVCVIDAHGKLAGSINAKALQGLTDLSVLRLPVREYQQLHALDTPITISPDATLKQVLQAVGPSQAVRAYALDGDGKPIFLITLNKILSSIINSGWEFNNVKVSDVIRLSHGPLQVRTVDAERTVGEALQEMAEHNMLSLPVLKNGKYVGMLDSMDVLGELIATLEDKQRGTLRESETTAAGYQHSITDKEVFEQVTSRPLSQFKYTGKDTVSENTTILDAIQNTFLPNRLHRVTVLNNDGKIVNVLTQKDIAKFITRYPDILGERADKTIEELGFLRRKVRHVNYRDTMMKAFQVMYHSSARAVAVVNGKGHLVANVHVGDLKGLKSFYQLRLMICFAKSQVPNPEDYPPDGIPLPLPPTCSPTATLSSVVQLLMEFSQRRVYVIDEKGYPVSEVTLSDIFRCIVKPGGADLFPRKLA